jgi:hypothetical protein
MAQEYKRVRIKRFAQLEERETPEGESPRSIASILGCAVGYRE